MSYQISDEESTDSECGIRFKTVSTRKIEDAPYVDKSAILGYDKYSSSNSSDRGYYSKSRREHRHRRSSSYEKHQHSSSPDVRHHHHRHKHKPHRKSKEDEQDHRKFTKHKKETRQKIDESESDSENNIVENTPKPEPDNLETYGPSLPPSNNDKKPEVLDEQAFIGPALPAKTEPYGPSLPPKSKKQTCIGPALPPGFKPIEAPAESDSDDDVIGPLPEGHASSSLSHKLLEERALEMKIRKLTPAGPEAPVREEWMLELPEVRAASLGLGPRQFRTKMGPDMSDRSSWTDTPQDKERKLNVKEVKVDLKKEFEIECVANRDKEQAKIVEKHKKKRKKDKSLVDMHREKLKKKVRKVISRLPTLRIF